MKRVRRILLPSDFSDSAATAGEFAADLALRYDAGIDVVHVFKGAPDLEPFVDWLEIDEANLTAWVEPGVVTGQLHAAVEALGLFYPPDPGSMKVCTIGGNVAENAGGLRGLKYGSTQNYVQGLDVVLPTGLLSPLLGGH